MMERSKGSKDKNEGQDQLLHGNPGTGGPENLGVRTLSKRLNYFPARLTPSAERLACSSCIRKS